MASVAAKIKKLLALGTSPNEHEAKTAMLKAQELMVKHSLTMRDVETEEQQQEVTIGLSTQTYTQAKWKPALANVIANNFRCHSIGRQVQSRGSATRICFVGLEDDVDIAMAVYSYAMKFVTHEAGRLKRQFYKSTGSAKGIEMSYAFGFVRGLKEQYEEQVASDSVYAMVLVKDQRVDDFIKEHTTKSVVHTTSKNHNGFAAMLGFSDGKTFSTSDKLTGEIHD